jgi:hypothetical protein
MTDAIEIEHDNVPPVIRAGDCIYDPDGERVGVVEECIALAEDEGWLVAYRDLSGDAYVADGWPTKLRGGVTPWGDRRIPPDTLAWALANAERLGFTHVIDLDDDSPIPIGEGVLRALSGDARWVGRPLSDDDTFTLYRTDGIVWSIKDQVCVCLLETLAQSRWERLRQPWPDADPQRRAP